MRLTKNLVIPTFSQGAAHSITHLPNGSRSDDAAWEGHVIKIIGHLGIRAVVLRVRRHKYVGPSWVSRCRFTTFHSNIYLPPSPPLSISIPDSLGQRKSHRGYTWVTRFFSLCWTQLLWSTSLLKPCQSVIYVASVVPCGAAAHVVRQIWGQASAWEFLWFFFVLELADFRGWSLGWCWKLHQSLIIVFLRIPLCQNRAFGHWK